MAFVIEARANGVIPVSIKQVQPILPAPGLAHKALASFLSTLSLNRYYTLLCQTLKHSVRRSWLATLIHLTQRQTRKGEPSRPQS